MWLLLVQESPPTRVWKSEALRDPCWRQLVAYRGYRQAFENNCGHFDFGFSLISWGVESQAAASNLNWKVAWLGLQSSWSAGLGVSTSLASQERRKWDMKGAGKGLPQHRAQTPAGIYTRGLRCYCPAPTADEFLIQKARRVQASGSGSCKGKSMPFSRQSCRSLPLPMPHYFGGPSACPAPRRCISPQAP